ncbi:cytochrome P450 [Mycena pura]|uniref:Cytochrome P450 n=1 Tax=Mycena pura TaxID=153505 RepID=A0AAD6XZI8_9AGAR|nr:cytochrome P450 [Mycena pura]
MDDPRFLVLAASLAILVLASVRNLKAFHNSNLTSTQLDAIPIVGSRGFLASFWDGYKFLANAPDMIQAGYTQYPNGIFRVARFSHWLVVVSHPKFVKEVGGAPEHILSFHEGVEDNLPVKQVIGRPIVENPYHQNTIRTSLTRNLHARFPEVRDEIACAFDEVLQLHDSEWKWLPALHTIMAVVARVSNRLFVGLPLCRNQTYLWNNVQFAIDVIQSGQKIALFPKIMRPLVATFISSKDKSFAVALQTLGPLVAERLAKEDELGPNWPGKPNDLISWLLEDAQGEERTVPALVLRVLSTNFAAIHTSSMAFTQALYDLTTNPEYLLPMREEAEHVIANEGWTKAALNSMVKIDSFLRESQRLNGNGSVAMIRKVVAKDGFRFSDGTVLPNGSFVCAAARAIHYDASNYKNATEFDGFRFARERAEHAATHDLTQDVFKRQMISTAGDFLPFGTGKHACPGRFFAATELKAMLAHVVINYELKAEVEGVRPQDNTFGITIAPNASARVAFRKTNAL